MLVDLKGIIRMMEKEMNTSQRLYDKHNQIDLHAERVRCADLCFMYNQIMPSAIEKREKHMRRIVGKAQKNFLIEQPFHCDFGNQIELGENFYANYNLTILDTAKVTFGDNVFIAPNCGFYTPGHPLDVERRNLGVEYAYPIQVGNNVWIGGNVIVLPGVSIGNNVVIGAGSVVVNDIPDNMLAVGNPCKVIRKICEDDKKKYIGDLK